MFRNSFINFVLDLVKIVVISLAIIIPVRYFLIQPFYVQGSSMEPNFHNSEYLIVDEISYDFHDPKRGDVVVFRYPMNPQEYFIKRVIGLPGEKLKFRQGDIYIYNDIYEHGVKLKEEYLSDNLETYYSGEKEKVIQLEEDEYYVLGDNRNSSRDSRTFGPINKSMIVGRAMFRGWPLDRMEFFQTPTYQFQNN
ncbi:MAG TPA: signal peptidase I [Patescibacteria group bacterium]|nr:signal peptidase I [Patescibacteria group bacterium]